MNEVINASELQPVDNGVINATDLQRVPDMADYVLPTSISRMIHGTPAAFGSGLNSTNMWGDINRPAQGARQAIIDSAMGKNPVQGFQEGYINPNSLSTSQIQENLLKNATPQTQSVLGNFIGGLPASTAGVIGDTAANMANPINALLSTVAPAISKTKFAQFSPDQYILGKGNGLIEKLRSNYVTDNLLPKVNQLFEDSVNKWTDSIQSYAKNKLKIDPDIISHISDRGTKMVQASANALNNTADTIYQTFKNGLSGKAEEYKASYNSSIDAVPNDHFIALPKTEVAMKGFLKDHNLIDEVGNLTGLAEDPSLSPALKQMVTAYKGMNIPSGVEASGSGTPVTPTMWKFMRDNMSDARRSDGQRYSSRISKVYDALHTDASDAGIPVDKAKALAAKYFDMENKADSFTTNTGENKFNNIFKLTQEQLNHLNEVDKYLGTNSVQQAKDLVANQALGKLQAVPEDVPFKPSLFGSNLEKASTLKGTGEVGKIKGDFEGLLGKSETLNQVFKGLKFKRNQEFIKDALGVTSIGAAALGGVSHLVDRLKKSGG